MISKINELKTRTNNLEVKALCEATNAAITSAIYNNVTSEAKLEIERVALTNLFETLKKYTSDTLIKEWLTNQQRVYSVQNLGVRKAINTLQEKEGKYDQTLAMALEQFKENLEYRHEAMLYEEFISAMSTFNYLPAVNTELSAIADRVKRYKNDVDITKIVETMKETRSNYLIPLIEDVIDNYLSNKNEQNRSILKETLVKFSYDPFIRDIINVLTLDATQLQLEYNNAACKITDNLYSPILYLGENETLFNIAGTYYVRKGNNINRIKASDVNNIDENYRNLCNLLNSSNIEISKKDIKVYIGNDNAIITESQTLINGSPFTEKQLKESAEASVWGGNTEFYNIVNTLKENFNEIAELDFVKRVYLAENEEYAADVFKLRDNIFITTLDAINNKSTFYRNINPIQAEKIMMEHMRFDVSETFREILPNKEKILSEIEQTKQEYTEYIKLIEERIGQFSTNIINESVNNAVIDVLKEELIDVKRDYQQYLIEAESFTNPVADRKPLNEGQFSWMTQDTGEQIGSEPSNTIPVYMYDDKGNKWEELEYEGYGVFGGKDYFELLAEMNGCEGEDRQCGIDIAYGSRETNTPDGTILYPALVTDPNYDWESHDFATEADGDPHQSWATEDYDNEDYDDEYYDYSPIDENLNITVQDTTSGKSYTVVVPTGAMAAKGERAAPELGAEGNEFGTEVGVSAMDATGDSGGFDGASSAVTFDDDESELLSDQPSDPDDKVDLDADELEAYADKVDAESDLDNMSQDMPGGEEGDQTNLDSDSGSSETDIDFGGEEDSISLDTNPDELDNEDGQDNEGNDISIDLNLDDEDDKQETEEDPNTELKKETTGAPDSKLTKTNFATDKNPNDLDEPKKPIKVYLKKPKNPNKK